MGKVRSLNVNHMIAASFFLLMAADGTVFDGCADINQIAIDAIEQNADGDEGCCSNAKDACTGLYVSEFDKYADNIASPAGLSSCGEGGSDCNTSGGCACNPTTATDADSSVVSYESGLELFEGTQIENAVQVRLSNTGFDFISAATGDIIETLLEGQGFDLDIEDEEGDPYLDFDGKIYVDVDDLEFTPTANCTANDTNDFSSADCIVVNLTANYRTCDDSGTARCTSAEYVKLGLYIQDGNLRDLLNRSNASDPVDQCKVKLNSDAGSVDGIPLQLKIALVEETQGPYEGFVRPRILDAQITDRDAMVGDIEVECTNLQIDIENLPDIELTLLTDDDSVWEDIIDFFDFGEEDSLVAVEEVVSCEGEGVSSKLAKVIEGNSEGIDISCSGSNTNCECDISLGDFIDDVVNDIADDDYFNNLIDAQLDPYYEICMSAESSSDCPSGSTYSSSAKTCTINGSGGRCVGPLMGTGGELTIEAPVSLVSTLPGLDATLSFMAALGGSGEVAANGYNLSMTLGIENLVHDDCVPELEEGDEGYVAAPSGLPRVSAFESNNRPSSSGVSSGGGFGGGTAGRNIPYDVGVAVSEEFLNYALFKMWDAGLMCASVTSAVSSQLSPTTLAALLGTTIKRMIFPLSTGGSYVGMNIRPQQPPEIELNSGVGGVVTTVDGNLGTGNVSLGGVDVTIRLPALYVDLYLWAQDRFVRLLTIATDIEVAGEIGIKEGEEGSELSVTLGEIVLANTEFINALSTVTSDNLSGSETVEGLANGTIPEYIGTISESIPNVAIEQLLNDSLGVPLPIPGSDGYMLPVSVEFSSSSLKAFKDDVTEDMFLGIFVDLNETDGSSSLSALPETRVEITHLSIPEDHGAFEVETWAEGELPYLEIAMSGSGPEGAEYEYSYRTTFTGWSEWSQSAYAMIEDESLVLQQRQKVYARARLKGVRNAADMTPAEAEFEIDVSEPMVEVTRDSTGEGQLQAFDLISSVTEMEYRVQSEDEQWSEWVPMRQGTVALGQIAYNTAVQVRDASGNVATSGNIRGALDVDAPQQSCSVRAPGAVGAPNNKLTAIYGIICMLLAMAFYYHINRRLR